MKARSRNSRVLKIMAPLVLLAACGDDTEVGTGGAGGTGTTGATTSTGPTTVASSSSSSTTQASSSSGSSDGGGNTTSDGGGGTGADGGGGATADGGGGAGGSNSGGGGAGQGGTGGAVPGVIEAEDCEAAEPVVLTLDQSLVFHGDTTGAADDLDTCFDADPDYDTGDLVFEFTLPADGSVRLLLRDSADLDSNFVFRGTICGDSSEEYCAPNETHGRNKGLATHLEAGTYYLVIDTVGEAAGDFQLIVQYGTPRCGDGIVNPDEECDVGVGVADDGCGDPDDLDNACQLLPINENFDICDGEAVDIEQGTTAFLASDGYSTVGFIHDYNGSCQLQPNGLDRVFVMTPAITGTVTARIGFDEANLVPVCETDPGAGCWDQLLYARSDCGDIESELDCADDTGPAGEEISFEVTADVPFYLFVDGYTNDPFSAGPFNLFVELEP